MLSTTWTCDAHHLDQEKLNPHHTYGSIRSFPIWIFSLEASQIVSHWQIWTLRGWPRVVNTIVSPFFESRGFGINPRFSLFPHSSGIKSGVHYYYHLGLTGVFTQLSSEPKGINPTQKGLGHSTTVLKKKKKNKYQRTNGRHEVLAISEWHMSNFTLQRKWFCIFMHFLFF